MRREPAGARASSSEAVEKLGTVVRRERVRVSCRVLIATARRGRTWGIAYCGESGSDPQSVAAASFRDCYALEKITCGVNVSSIGSNG